jgi:hypothetical protein
MAALVSLGAVGCGDNPVLPASVKWRFIWDRRRDLTLNDGRFLRLV